MDKNTFKLGDHVVRKSHVHDEGIVLAKSEDTLEEKYYVIFAERSEYNAYPSLELIRVEKISLVRSEIHKPQPTSKFKK